MSHVVLSIKIPKHDPSAHVRKINAFHIIFKQQKFNVSPTPITFLYVMEILDIISKVN
jgi:hypothetical protein